MTEDAPVLTLHQEVVRTGVQRVGTRVARLQRVVVRERRTIEVEVAHEEYRVVYDEIDAADAEAAGAEPGPRSVSTVLREERIEVVRRIVPVERVTLTAEPTGDEQRTDVTVRHEEVDEQVERL